MMWAGWTEGRIPYWDNWCPNRTGMPYSNKYGEKWDCAPFLDVEEAEKIRDYLNTCEYIEIGIHGLLHEAWGKDGTWLGGEFAVAKDFQSGAPLAPVPEWYLRSHLDAFMEIYHDWGFTQELRSFTCPGHCKGSYDTDYFARTLSEYGIKYCHEGDAEPKCCSIEILQLWKNVVTG